MQRLVGRVNQLLAVAHIDGERERPPPDALDEPLCLLEVLTSGERVSHGFQIVAAEIAEDDVGPFRSKPQCVRPALTPRRAGDERNLAVEACHDSGRVSRVPAERD